MSHSAPHATNIGENYHNVLIVRFSLLGDVAMTVPVVYSVCDAHPETRFIMATGPVASALFVNAPHNLTVFSVDPAKYHGTLGMNRLAKNLIDEYKIDAMIDLQDEYETWALGACMHLHGVGKVLRIDKGRKGKQALTRRTNKRMLPLISSRERYREVFNRLGFVFEETFTSLYASGKGDEKDFAHISAPKQPGERWIAVAPFAKYSGKIYPMHLMEKVIDAISQWDKVKIFLLGQGDNERDQFRQWVAKYPNTITLAETRHGFAAELALLSHCDAMLSMDNMNMHLASMVRLPVVSVWGATHPYCGFMGWKQDETNVVQLNMACRPCSLFGEKKCYYNDFFCLTGIQPQMIVAAVERVLTIQC